MSRRIFFSGATAVVLILICVHLSPAQTSQNTGADETAIRQLVKLVEDGWNNHDGKAFAAPFATDADYVVVNGMTVKGREAIENGHANIFKTIYKDSHNVSTVKSIRFLRPDVAVADIEWNLEFCVGGETK